MGRADDRRAGGPARSGPGRRPPGGRRFGPVLRPAADGKRGTPMTTTPTGGPRPGGPYGEYRDYIRDLFASCEDYLGRIRRTLQGGQPSRHYVTEKAQALRNAASRLLAGCHDVEGWLRQCRQEFTEEDWEGEPYVSECELEAGH